MLPFLGNLNMYRNYVRDLPLIEPPEAFGQHVNAEIASSVADARSLMATLLSIQGSSAGGNVALPGEAGTPVGEHTVQ
jgi:dynein heavy chain